MASTKQTLLKNSQHTVRSPSQINEKLLHQAVLSAAPMLPQGALKVPKWSQGAKMQATGLQPENPGHQKNESASEITAN